MGTQSGSKGRGGSRKGGFQKGRGDVIGSAVVCVILCAPGLLVCCVWLCIACIG